jgi:hypothetical protein
MKIGKKAIPRIITVVITLVIGISLGLWQVKPPRVDESSLDYQAYQQMMGNIKRLASMPHPSVSEEIEHVRAELLAEIESMGLTPIVEDASYTASELAELRARQYSFSLTETWEKNSERIMENYGIQSIEEFAALREEEFAHEVKRIGADSLQNILVKLDVPDTERGVMFVSHYDSVPDAPGAADAMLPVCAMLEAMRVLSQSGELMNDMYFLFTDGEEHFLLGARKFVEAHSDLKNKIDMVINLEMRGNSGGLILFETSPRAYQQMKTVVNSGAKPIGMSFAAAIYAMMPNNTDFTVFLEHGFQGVNFAAIEGVVHYHMPTDTYENIGRNTAWQYLQTTFTLANHAANQSLDELRESSLDAVYFPFLPSMFVLMTVQTSQILCAAICVLSLVFCAVQIKGKRLKVSFSTILMGLLFLLSVGSAVFFAAGSYLFYIPLLAMVVTKFLEKWTPAYFAVRALSGITVLLLWIPVVFLLWVSMIQPMML